MRSRWWIEPRGRPRRDASRADPGRGEPVLAAPGGGSVVSTGAWAGRPRLDALEIRPARPAAGEASLAAFERDPAGSPEALGLGQARPTGPPARPSGPLVLGVLDRPGRPRPAVQLRLRRAGPPARGDPGEVEGPGRSATGSGKFILVPAPGRMSGPWPTARPGPRRSPGGARLEPDGRPRRGAGCPASSSRADGTSPAVAMPDGYARAAPRPGRRTAAGSRSRGSTPPAATP